MPVEPRYHHEAMRHLFAEEWKKAELAELADLEALKQLGTYQLVSRSSAESFPIPLKWVYKY